MKSLIERIEDHLRTCTPYEIDARIGAGLLAEALVALKRLEPDHYHDKQDDRE